MSRGGRGGGGRGGKRGPDMSWDDEESTEVLADTRKPGPLFPERYLPAPKPLTTSEKASVNSLISLRDRIRGGPSYAVLSTTISQIADNSTNSTSTPSLRREQIAPTAKPNPRAGFDPFNDQEKYTMKYHRKRRTFPDLSQRDSYTLKYFPPELWTVLDPKHNMPDWNELSEEQKARMAGTTRGKKRKREKPLKFDDIPDDAGIAHRHSSGSDNDSNASNSNDEDDEDALDPSGRRKRTKNRDKKKNKNAEARSAGQKKGLDAEDDYPDVEQDEDADGGPGGDDEPHDSEFGTDDGEDDGADDYNAEQYFDDGADEADDGGDGGEEGGGVY